MDTFSEGNQRRIQRLADQLRTKHDAMSWEVTPNELIRLEGIHYQEYNLNEEGFIAKITRRLKAITEKVKAILVVREATVLVDKHLHPAKKPFGQSHELGHHAIPEHKEILYVCSEEDLNPKTRKEMEFEANVFASEILLPFQLMKNIYEEYPLSMETILLLKQLSNSSYHSAAIKYVSGSDKECCLLILSPEKDTKGNLGLRLDRQIWSRPWRNRYKKKIIGDRQFLSAEHNLSKVVFSDNPEVIVNNTVRLKNPDLVLGAQTFFNQYIVLALLTPLSSAS